MFWWSRITVQLTLSLSIKSIESRASTGALAINKDYISKLAEGCSGDCWRTNYISQRETHL